ncbi:ensconsin-like isoform X2 [Conger conger]|uniref:ensconsin-like isoform X2 n=1 Tax=Conger conger TaxID=82655 RepID=UPI002A5AD2A3|nr:ensconsin-like isoform X2 [Conger conger]
MAEVAMSLKGMRAQMAAAAQAQADERRSQALSSTGSEEAESPASSTESPGARPVIDGSALRIDDKLRVAKERREEQDKQQVTRESQIQERERKTKQQYERQMEERQRKLEEQRRKEGQRRAAAEEKRKLKQEEEREHYEAVLRRTVERSQKLDQRQKRWSWGGGLTADSGDSGGPTVVTPSSPVKSRRKASTEVDKRSASAMNLKQQSDSVVSKRLSSSSAAITKSPEKSTKPRSSSLSRLHNNTSHPAKDPLKPPQVEQTGPSQQKRSSSLSSGVGGKLLPSPKIERKAIKDEQARRPPATPLENSALSRLLTSTKASLARSKSSAALSAEGSDPQASASPLHLSRGPLRSHSTDRQKGSDGSARSSQKSEKRFSSPGTKRPASPSSGPSRRRSPSPVSPPSNTSKRPASPATAKQSPRNRPPSPSSAKQRPPSPQPSSRPPPIQRPALTPTGPPTLRKRDSKPKDSTPGQPVTPQPAETPPPSNAPSGKNKDDSKAIAGTTSAEAAAKMLSENRRLAREQKEREEQLRVQREEEERLRKEEEERVAEEERVRREEEEKRRAEERKILEAQQALVAEEERVRLEIEEQERQAELQKEREEAEARALVEAEMQRQERERIMQQNQQERMQRRKRIEEIMKRTRKTDQNDYKRDDEKGMLDENEEEDSEAKDDDPKEGDCAYGEAEFEAEGWSLQDEGPMAEQEGSMIKKSEMDNKENRSILSQRDPGAVSPTPKALLVEGSEFLNEDSKMGLLPGLNGRVGPWSFEELIELGVHPKAGPLISADGGPEKSRVAFEDKGSAVGTLHSGQPIEALSEM